MPLGLGGEGRGLEHRPVNCRGKLYREESEMLDSLSAGQLWVSAALHYAVEALL